MINTSFTDEQLLEWKSFKVSICMFIKKNELFWVVPAYTGKDRAEISIDDFIAKRHLLAKILDAFPDSKIISVVKPPK